MSEEKALANLANLCSKGEHCAGELIDKMRRWGLDEAAQERVVAYLEEHHFIDETRYCHALWRTRCASTDGAPQDRAGPLHETRQ